MSDFVGSSMPATGPILTVSAERIEAITSNSAVTCSTAAEEIHQLYNTSDTSNAAGQTEPPSVSDINHVANRACNSSCNNNAVEDENVNVAGVAAEKMCNDLEDHAEGSTESPQPTPAANELRSSVSKVQSAVEPVIGPLQITEEQCRSDTVTFSLPLEVIGACWFMKRDTETCLQATTTSDGLFSSSVHCYIRVLLLVKMMVQV